MIAGDCCIMHSHPRSLRVRDARMTRIITAAVSLISVLLSVTPTVLPDGVWREVPQCVISQGPVCPHPLCVERSQTALPLALPNAKPPLVGDRVLCLRPRGGQGSASAADAGVEGLNGAASVRPATVSTRLHHSYDGHRLGVTLAYLTHGPHTASWCGAPEPHKGMHQGWQRAWWGCGYEATCEVGDWVVFETEAVLSDG